jgi:hypothetical protein
MDLEGAFKCQAGLLRAPTVVLFKQFVPEFNHAFEIGFLNVNDIITL